MNLSESEWDYQEHVCMVEVCWTLSDALLLAAVSTKLVVFKFLHCWVRFVPGNSWDRRYITKLALSK